MWVNEGRLKVLNLLTSYFENWGSEIRLVLITEAFEPELTWTYSDLAALSFMIQQTGIYVFPNGTEAMISGEARLPGNTQTYINESESEVTIYGWGLYHNDAELLLCIKPFATPISVPPTGEFIFTPTLRVDDLGL